MSKHHFRRYPNLIKGFSPIKAHELWVSDITYIPLKERFAYLFLITDAYSRKIVGFHVSDDMKVSSAVVALKKALAQKPPETIVIHHSDRGIQYCSNEYVSLLQQSNAMISMTESGDPLENAMAERVNGILKQNSSAVIIVILMQLPYTSQDVLPSTITGAGTQALTGRYRLMCIHKKARR